MKKNLTLLIIGFFSFISAKAQISISNARLLPIGTIVTVQGIVLNGDELGGIRYLQDGTGGIGSYPTGGSQANYIAVANRGALVRITGPLTEFQGLLQVAPITSYSVLSTGNALPAPLEIPADLLNEMYEGSLVKIVNASTASAGNFVGNTNYNYTWNATPFTVRINSASTGLSGIVGKPILSGPIQLVGIVGQYQTTYQLLPRLIEDISTYTPPITEINVKKGNTTILSSTTVYLGNAASTVFTIQNLGSSGDLAISLATITGTNASMFSFSGMPTSVATTSSANFSLNFSPSGSQGTKTATITINNNDSDESTFVINVEAIYGVGATEPVNQPSALSFSNQKSFTHTLNYVASNPAAEKYIVLRKIGSPVADIPADNNTYQKGDYIGSSQVAYIGSGTSFTPRHVIANTSYYYAVFAFNGNSGFENYLQTNPLTGSVTSSDGMIGNYYSTGTPPLTSSPTFLTDLSAKINPHTAIPYVQYPSDVIDKFEARDTTLGRQVITCVYSGENKIFTGPFNWVANGYSREHSYCHNWMPTNPANSPEKPEYNDRHHLFPTNLNDANVPRSNYPLGKITGTVSQSYLEGKLGLNSLGEKVYEPRDSHKGNAARAIMYVATCYNGVAGNNWKLRDPISGSIAYGQDQDILKAWHFQDPPDNYEIARNDYIFSIQGNRNPFIDSVHFACYIDFDNMVKINSLGGSSCITEMTLQKTQTNTTCNQINGSASINIINGIAPYTYTWTNGVSTTSIATGLAAGNYSVKVTDNIGQKANANFVILNGGNATFFNFIKNDASGLCGNNNGSATVVIDLNANAPYTYTWLNIGQSTATATGLAAGNYTLALTNAIGCVSQNTIQISDGAAHFGPITFSTENILCNNQNSGSASVTTNLIGATSYLWDASANNQTNASATGLSSGVYTVAVTNGGCTVYGTSPLIEEPVFPIKGQISVVSTSCCGGNDGEAKALNVSGGTSPYVYNWNSTGYTLSSSLYNIPAGTFPKLTIKDANGCLLNLASNTAIPQPSPINVSFITDSQTDAINPNGLISVYPSGGTPFVVGTENQYDIISYPDLGFAKGLNDIYNAPAGTYTIVFSDSKGCSKTITGVVVKDASLTNISNLENEKSIFIYPNPTNSNLTIQVDVLGSREAIIEIKDIVGRIVFETSEHIEKGKKEILVTTENFAKGTYFVGVLVENSNTVTRIVIE